MIGSQTETNGVYLKQPPTQYAKLFRYVPADIFFARFRVAGKLIHDGL